MKAMKCCRHPEPEHNMSELSAKRPVSAASDSAVKFLSLVISIADGCVTFLIYVAGLPPGDRPDTFLPLGLVFASMYAGTFVHELGHAIGAIISGWRVIIFAVRPFALHLANANFVLGGKKTFPKRLGFVVAVPGSPIALSAGRWAVFIAGGPVASFLFALYLGLAAAVLSKSAAMSSEVRFSTAICVGFAIHSFCVCILTLLPRKQPGHTSDGWKLLRAIADPHNLAERKATFWLAALRSNRIRPRALPQWMIDEIPPDAAKSARLTKAYDELKIARILDAKKPDFIEARQKIEQFRHKYGASEWLCGCDAYVAAIHENDPDRAATVLAIPHSEHPVPELTLAAKAALSARLGMEEDMERYLSEMDKVLYRNSPFKNVCYADIRRNIQALFYKERQNRAARRSTFTASVPEHF